LNTQRKIDHIYNKYNLYYKYIGFAEPGSLLQGAPLAKAFPKSFLWILAAKGNLFHTLVIHLAGTDVG
jgi:hypothetical protein